MHKTYTIAEGSYYMKNDVTNKEEKFKVIKVAKPE